MDETSIGRTTNTHSWNILPAIIQHLLSSFTNYIFNGDTNVNVTNIEIEIPNGCFVDSVFGSVPSSNEVEHAVAALQSFMHRLPNSALRRKDQRMVQSSVLERIDDAFHLLQTVPSVQRMVVSVGSDESVWNAVMKNNEIQEFQRSIKQAKSFRPSRSDGDDEKQDLVSVILWWMLNNVKLTLMGLTEKLKSLVSKSFEQFQEENTNRESKHQLQELINSTVLLSILTLMIVIVTRAYES